MTNKQQKTHKQQLQQTHAKNKTSQQHHYKQNKTYVYIYININ